jgi:formate/nitrite transporter FocA (FNT family)
MENKKGKLRKWVVELLGTIVCSWFVFIATTIETMGNETYDVVLVVWTIVACFCIYLLKVYTDILD